VTEVDEPADGRDSAFGSRTGAQCYHRAKAAFGGELPVAGAEGPDDGGR